VELRGDEEEKWDFRRIFGVREGGLVKEEIWVKRKWWGRWGMEEG
jgi:hypothetical protein